MRSGSTTSPTMPCRYLRAASGVSFTPSRLSTSLFGIQTPPPDRAVEPPK